MKCMSKRTCPCEYQNTTGCWDVPPAASDCYLPLFDNWYQNDSGPWTAVKYEIAKRAFIGGMMAAAEIAGKHYSGAKSCGCECRTEISISITKNAGNVGR